jgi:Ca2+-binding EF-hand superfamily protein
MRCKALSGLGLLAFLLAVLAAPAFADDKKKPDPPGTTPYMNQLRGWFKAADLDSDGYLDKAELAKAFRGPNAKPYDYKKEGNKDKKDADKKADDKKDDVKDKGKDTSPSKPDYSQYPDYNFLMLLDKDNDEKISKDEFESWARDYAVELKKQDDQLKKVEKLEQRLANASTKKEIQQAERGAEVRARRVEQAE